MTWREAGILARSTLRALADSTRTAEVHTAEELTGRNLYRRYLDDHRDNAKLQELLEHRPELCSAQVDYDALRLLPDDTLGRHYTRYLDDHGLSADHQAVPTTHVEDPEIAYLMRRYRQTHDVWHPLLGLGTEGYEETLVHAFSWGQLRLPLSGMVVIGGMAKHMVFEGRMRVLRHGVKAAWQSGRNAEQLLPEWFERYWDEPIASVRERLNLQHVVEFANRPQG